MFSCVTALKADNMTAAFSPTFVHFRLLYYFLFLILLFRTANSTENTPRQYESLNGVHLIVGGFPFPVSTMLIKNATGYILDFYGSAPEILNWLSRKYNFTYSILQVDDTTVEPAGPNRPGYAYYLTSGECDVILASLTLTNSRLSKMYFTQYFMDGRGIALVPMPLPVQNIQALLKPFDSSVWIGVGLSLVISFLVLHWFNYQKFAPVDPLSGQTKNSVTFERSLRDVSQYIISVALTQGGHFDNSMTSFKILAGVWCLVAFILTSSYTCVLVSFVTTPSVEILAESMLEVAFKPNVKIVVEKGLGSDIVFSNSKNSPDKGSVLIGEKLHVYANSRCTKQQQCVDLVKSGSHAFIGGIFPAMAAMRNDFLLEGRCNLLFARKLQTSFLPLAMGIRKNAGIVEYFDRGILRMHENGLIDVWVKKYSPDVRHCLVEGQSALGRKPNGNNAAITLSNLSGTFVVLGVGLCLALVTFVAECLSAFISSRKALI